MCERSLTARLRTNRTPRGRQSERERERAALHCASWGATSVLRGRVESTIPKGVLLPSLRSTPRGGPASKMAPNASVVCVCPHTVNSRGVTFVRALGAIAAAAAAPPRASRAYLRQPCPDLSNRMHTFVLIYSTTSTLPQPLARYISITGRQPITIIKKHASAAGRCTSIFLGFTPYTCAAARTIRILGIIEPVRVSVSPGESAEAKPSPAGL